MKSIKYQQFRASTPSSPKGFRTLTTFREPNIFQNYDLPLMSDRFLLNNNPSPKTQSSSPRKHRIISSIHAEVPQNLKMQKRERSYSYQTKQNMFESTAKSQVSSNLSMLASTISEKNEISLPIRMIYENKNYDSSIVYGYSSFHSSLKQKKKSPKKINHLNDYLEIKQIELLERIKSHNIQQKSKQNNKLNEQNNYKNKQGFFQISIFNYSNLNRNDLDNIINHKQINLKSIK